MLFKQPMPSVFIQNVHITLHFYLNIPDLYLLQSANHSSLSMCNLKVHCMFTCTHPEPGWVSSHLRINKCLRFCVLHGRAAICIIIIFFTFDIGVLSDERQIYTNTTTHIPYFLNNLLLLSIARDEVFLPLRVLLLLFKLNSVYFHEADILELVVFCMSILGQSQRQ